MWYYYYRSVDDNAFELTSSAVAIVMRGTAAFDGAKLCDFLISLLLTRLGASTGCHSQGSFLMSKKGKNLKMTFPQLEWSCRVGSEMS